MEKREAERRLAELYSERGYVRVPSSDRRRAEDSQSYRKGWEARLVVETASAAREVRRWLRDAGFEAGNAYAKHSRWVVPLYGRSAVGRLGGRLAHVRPDDLAAHAIGCLLHRHPDLDRAAVEDVVWGAANQAGEDNRNVGRMAVLLAGLPIETGGLTVNRLCGSGMQAVITAAHALADGWGEIMIAGGSESMSRAPYV